ncbi:DNA-methyltransferase [Corynebacterium sp. A21]|uniref:DNA-methyltransferase n=1 Tax=Corynebacterium sp. A21 TaxID=3457318 RepID=UPI003FCF7C24
MLRRIPADSVQSVVTSPPYYNLRDYGHPEQLGNEETPDAYVSELVHVFRAVKRPLRDDGVLWVNLADTYAGHADNRNVTHGGRGHATGILPGRVNTTSAAPRKSLLGIPWRFALAMQEDGWIIRNSIIWHKPNGTPESVKDRLTRRHENLLMFTQSQSYRFDLDPIRDERGSSPGDVWKLSTRPSKADHFAMYPRELPERCISASTVRGDTVLDPFSGLATTGLAALGLDRRYIGVDVEDSYNAQAQDRLTSEWESITNPDQQPLFEV